jgi:hypothetical protein
VPVSLVGWRRSSILSVFGSNFVSLGHAALSDYAPNILEKDHPDTLKAYTAAEIAAQDAHKHRWVDYDRAEVQKKK